MQHLCCPAFTPPTEGQFMAPLSCSFVKQFDLQVPGQEFVEVVVVEDVPVQQHAQPKPPLQIPPETDVPDQQVPNWQPPVWYPFDLQKLGSSQLFEVGVEDEVEVPVVGVEECVVVLVIGLVTQK